ncbi:type 1 glutamine amidotransferase domain-containing protein [Halobacteriovorax sp. GB3]|uniref:type 1 glutamine amidotransferase domain-containing protein n=1 Tax=Halobacteriovorax sp. GB3 TaxID=2719615 RepID=UPI00235EC30F|nr:type 1 glutamine amidotransferase domain-containing protein [Halobacteriovorax sp. GB3]MDD0853632.1 type 1 glutamine amidotransferase domain-containing protein [Halobacteriovorax sp. GB3]
MKILIPIPHNDFDPTEVAVSWKILKTQGHDVTFATPSGKRAMADKRMLTGEGLGIWKKILMADENGINAYLEMESSSEFLNPKKWDDIVSCDFDGIILGGGHAQGMVEYLESNKLQTLTAEFDVQKKPIGAICHGVVLASRSKREDGRSILFNKRVTSLRKDQEFIAWAMTGLWLGNYYRTYPEYVQDEVKRSLKSKGQFELGPMAITRDTQESLCGFCVVDEHFISSRWPGDVHTFATKYCEILKEKSNEL